METSVRGTPVEITAGTVILVLIGLALVGYGGYDYVQQSEAIEDAVEVEATVAQTSVTEIESGRSGIEYDAHIDFRYQYRGTEYTSDQMFPGSFDATYETHSEAESVLDSYGEGETVTAYVDPDAPGEGFLEHQTSQGPLQFIAIGTIILVVVSLNVVGARRPGRGTVLESVDDHSNGASQTLTGYFGYGVYVE